MEEMACAERRRAAARLRDFGRGSLAGRHRRDGHAVLPEGMTHLPDYAFFGAPLSSRSPVRNAESLVSIGNSAFVCCSSLISIDLSASLTSIGSRAFWGCSALASIALPDSLTSIGDYAFQECSALASVTFPAGLPSIGMLAFHRCSALTSVTFPASLTSIGSCAFYRCSSLAPIAVSLRDGLSIGNRSPTAPSTTKRR